MAPSEAGVVEISYLGQSGAEAAAMNDAFHIFEAESRAEHARDPSHPIYRILTGQNASRFSCGLCERDDLRALTRWRDFPIAIRFGASYDLSIMPEDNILANMSEL